MSLKTVAMKEDMQPQSLMKLPFYKNTSLVVLVDDCIYSHKCQAEKTSYQWISF
jgi:hypothetical protein